MKSFSLGFDIRWWIGNLLEFRLGGGGGVKFEKTTPTCLGGCLGMVNIIVWFKHLSVFLKDLSSNRNTRNSQHAVGQILTSASVLQLALQLPHHLR